MTNPSMHLSNYPYGVRFRTRGGKTLRLLFAASGVANRPYVLSDDKEGRRDFYPDNGIYNRSGSESDLDIVEVVRTNPSVPISSLVAQIREQKQDLEDHIARLLNQFHTDTGCTPESVELHHVNGDSSQIIINVNIQVTL